MARSVAACSAALCLLLVSQGCQAAEHPLATFLPVDHHGLPFDLSNTSPSSFSLPSWLFECAVDEVRQTAACGHHVLVIVDVRAPFIRVIETVAIMTADLRGASVATHVPLGSTLDVPVRSVRRVGDHGGGVALSTPLPVPPVCHPRDPLYQWEDPASAGVRFEWDVTSAGGVYLWSYTMDGAWLADARDNVLSWRCGLDSSTLPGGVHRQVVRATVGPEGVLYLPTPFRPAVQEEDHRAVTWEEWDVRLDAPGQGTRFSVVVSLAYPFVGFAGRVFSRELAVLLGGLVAALVTCVVGFSNAGCGWAARSRLRRRNAAWEHLSRRLAAGAISRVEFGTAAARLAVEEDVLAAAPRLGHTPEHRRRLAQLVTTRQLMGEFDLAECNRRLGVLAAQHKVLAAEAASGAGWAAPGRWFAEAEAWLDEVALASDGPVARALDVAIQHGWFRASQGEFVGAATAMVVVVWGLYVMQR